MSHADIVTVSPEGMSGAQMGWVFVAFGGSGA